MRCCGRELVSVELQVAGQPFALLRCGECDANYWTRDGVRVSRDEVTEALQEQTLAAAASKPGPRPKRAG